MIVRNESHVIRETLDNLCSHINFDYWVIVDTGSTDDTMSIIAEYFNNKSIPGELHEFAWVNFGVNRSYALTRAYNKSEYLLFLMQTIKFAETLSFPPHSLLINIHLKWVLYSNMSDLY